MLKLIASCFIRCLAGLGQIARLHPGVIAVSGVDPRHS
jgi:hypothetical protein